MKELLEKLIQLEQQPTSSNLSPDEVQQMRNQSRAANAQIPADPVTTTPGQDFSASNLAIVKSLVNADAIKRFADQAAQGRAPIDKTEWMDHIKKIDMWDDPRGIIQVELNAGITVDEIMKLIPKDFNLKAKPLGYQGARNKDLLKV